MISISGDERELRALAVLLDAAVKALGVRGAADAVNWVAKIEQALLTAQQKPAE